MPVLFHSEPRQRRARIGRSRSAFQRVHVHRDPPARIGLDQRDHMQRVDLQRLFTGVLRRFRRLLEEGFRAIRIAAGAQYPAHLEIVADGRANLTGLQPLVHRL
jgi:hypothetical protein